MNRIIDGVYVGCLSDSRDKEQLTKFNISHILTILDEPTKGGIKVIVKISMFLKHKLRFRIVTVP